MKSTYLIIFAVIIAFSLGYITRSFMNDEKNDEPKSVNINTQADSTISIDENLGAFSVSLNVKDLAIARDFYQKLGFNEFGGGMEMNYLIMKNGNALIGLFQNMFEGNILTFNPGWDENAENMDKFVDIRTLQERFLKNGIKIDPLIVSGTKGPASFMISDPDSNLILFDQHR